MPSSENVLCHSRSCVVFSPYLLQFLHHLLDAQLAAAAHLVLHLSQPVAELLVLVVEDGPGVEAVGDLLSSQGHLGVGEFTVAFSQMMNCNNLQCNNYGVITL